MKLKKGDTVKVLSGNDKGKTGEVLTVLPKSNKVVVKDVNIRKKATKPKPCCPYIMKFKVVNVIIFTLN